MSDVKVNLSQLLPQYKVEGFDPNSALTKVVDVDDKGQETTSLFMKYMPAMAWFLTVFPDGCFNHQFNLLNAQKATVTASIYRNSGDNRPAATATCTRYYDESANGKYYEQNAVTAAYRKALGYLGFGTPLDAHEVDGIPVENGADIPDRTDVGVVIATVAPPSAPAGLLGEDKTAGDKASAPKPQKPATRRGRKPKTQVAPVQEEAVMVEDLDTPNMEAKPAAPVTENDLNPGQDATDFASALQDLTQVTEQPSVPSAPVPAATLPEAKDVPESNPRTPMTLEDALKVRITRGKMRGKTIEEAAASEGKAFIRWHCDLASKQDPHSPLTEALQLYCEYYGC